jgi:fatty acid-binding protein DegV
MEHIDMKANSEITSASTAGDAAMLEAWRNLSSTQRDLLGRVIDGMLSGADAKSAESLQKWGRQACLALVETKTMASSIGYLVEKAEEDGPDCQGFAMLEAINACIDRIERFVSPAIDCAPEVVSHD